MLLIQCVIGKKVGNMKTLLMILALLIPSISWSEVKVHLVLLKGPYALSKGAANTVMAKALAEYKLAGRPIRFYKVTEMDDPSLELNTLATKYTKYYALKKFGMSKHWIKKGTVVHFLTPPKVEANGIRYLDGLASLCSIKSGGISTGAGTEVNQNGANRINASTVSLLHEVAHARCANHDDSNMNIMNSAPLPFADQGLHFNKKAIKEMKK